MPPRPSHPRPRCAISSAPLELWDSAGESAAAASRGDRLWQAAELASGAVGNERAADLAREAFRYGVPPRGAAWGHERLGRYLWAAGHIEDCAAEFAAAAALLPADAGPEAAPVFAGLGQAELMLGHYDAAHERAQRVVELLTNAEADPVAWAMARRVAGIVVDHGGDPARGVDLCREAVDTAPSALTRMLAVLYLGVALLDAGRVPRGRQRDARRGGRRATDGARPQFRRLPRRPRGGGAHTTRPVVRGRQDSGSQRRH